MTSILKSLRQRNLISAITHPNIDEAIARSINPSAYCGFDPTASSIHVGNLVQIMTLCHLQRAGIRPILLVGGATGMIGDPSGKSDERVLLTEDIIRENVKGIQSSLSTVLDFDCPKVGAKVMNNFDWHGKMSTIDWMRETGRYFRVNSMLSKDSVKRRLESDQGISYLEFSYQLFQAYDFLHLFKNEGCVIQIGGSDQWGNITAGTDLIRKSTGKEAYGITIPLLTTSTGEKYGKSAGNAIWLNEEKTSTYELFQYFMRAEDADVEQLLYTFTLEDVDNIKDIISEHRLSPEKRLAQKHLAEYVTQMIHGKEGKEKAIQASSILFGGSIEGLKAVDILSVIKDAPSSTIEKQNFLGQNIVEVAVSVGSCKSKAECRRLIKSGGLYVNNQRVTDALFKLEKYHLIDGHICLLRTGRRNYRVIQILSEETNELQ